MVGERNSVFEAYSVDANLLDEVFQHNGTVKGQYKKCTTSLKK